MADVTYLHEPDDDQTLTFCPHRDFDSNAFDPEFPIPDPSLSLCIQFSQPFEIESAIYISRAGDDFFGPLSGSIPNTDLLDRENQVNSPVDLFQLGVEQSQVMGDSDLVSEALQDSGFGVIDGHSDGVTDDMRLNLGLVLGIGDDNLGFSFDCSCSGGVGDEDDFFIGRRVSGSESGEVPSTTSAMRLGFGSDSDDEENGVLGISLDLNDEYNVHDENDDVASIPLCWDSLHLEDNRDRNEDFEWEEVDGGVDEAGVLSVLMAEEEDRSVSVSLSSMTGILEEGLSSVRVGGMENLEWEVLLNASDLDNEADPYFGDHYDYLTAEYEMMYGQFAENENPYMGRPPASISVVQNLPSVVVTKEDVDKNNTHCAVCKDDFAVGEQVKQLPCSHRFHGDCILPWLGIRNTCPICRNELPTDDADYDLGMAQGAGHRL